MKTGPNEITILGEHVGVVSYDPDEQRLVVDQNALIFFNLPAIEQILRKYEFPGAPLVLQMRFNAIMGHLAGELTCVDIQYPVDIKTTALPKICINRSDIEEFLKENPESDTIILSKTEDRKDDVRRYELAREVLLGDESDSDESATVDVFDPKSHFYSKMV